MQQTELFKILVSLKKNPKTVSTCFMFDSILGSQESLPSRQGPPLPTVVPDTAGSVWINVQLHRC